MSSTPKSNKNASDTDNQTPDTGGGTTPEPRSPISRSATPSSKSFRATNRLARRARSFKEDFLEKISQMRNTATAPIGTTTPTTLVDSSGLNNRLGGRETPTLVDGGADDEKVVMMLGGRGSPTVKKGSGDKMGGIGSGVDKGPVHEFDMLTKQLQTALMYFRSLVANDKLEMLAGNGTIILDTVWAINLAVKSSCAAGIQSNTDMSWKIKEATQAMYHNASRLIKVCDDALINQDDVDEKKKDLKKDDEETKAKKNLYRESVEKVLATLEDSVKFLLNIARDSLTPPPPNKLNHYKITPNNNHHHHHRNSTNYNLIDSAHQHSGSQQQLLLRPPSPSPNAPAQQRNSLPDIPLTPRERELLNEKQNRHSSSEENGGCEGGGEGNGDCVDGRERLGKNSFSAESVLKDVELGSAVPPPKPPLPQSLALRSLLMGNCASPPPLPPKKNKSGKYGLENMAYIDQISYNLERSSLRSRSPEDSISLLSASAGSLDSMLNHSREEEEIKSIMDHTDSDTVLENDISDAFVASHHHTTVTSSSSHNSTSSQQVTHQSCGNRLSNTDSGVVSMHSLRNSSCSKRSSVTSSSSNAIKHVEVSNNESIVRTSSVETEATLQISHQTYCGSQITSSVTSSTVNSSSSSNSSSTVSMLSSNNNNHVQHNMQHCRLDSTATTAEDDDEYDFKNMGSVDFEDDVILQGGDKERSANSGGDVPPVLPQKMRKNVGIKERMPSPYDNVTDISNHKSGEFIVTCQMHQSHQSLSSSVSIGSSISQDNGKPPPLPPKKKHIMAYMEMFGNCSHANDEFMRHSVHMMHGNWAASGPGGGGSDGQQAMSSTQSCSFSSQNTWRTQSLALHQLSMDANPSLPSNNHSLYSHHSYNHAPPLSKSPLPHPHFTSTPTSASKFPLTSQASNPPALPPKRLRTPSTLVTPPPSPPPPSQLGPTQHITTIIESGTGTTGTTAQHASNRMSDDVPTLGDCSGLTAHGQVSAQLPDLLEHTTAVAGGAGGNKQQLQDPNAITAAGSVTSGTDEKWRSDLMEATDIDDYLVLKKADEDMPDIRGGSVDALIIQASMATRNSGFSYQEAFLTTYRTFIAPCELITKLIRRYYFFYRQTDKKKRFREAFALIVCVVNDLVSSDLDTLLHQMLMDFDQSLIADGELVLAKALRIKLLEKHDNKLHKLQQSKQILSNQNAANNNAPTMSPNVATPSNKGAQTLLDFKSEQIAEQMTLLDAELFMRIEIPEVLIWVQEQKEETSPNLTRFTEHFNKMSYWARTRILLADARDRERYFVKFIKIMKQLRKINNFNSYLALLSALDSAPVRRLEWQKHVQDGLKEYCALIDSSSSFRAYRQALAETSPPCIPYIGLVLQDLTFVHIGNSNLLSNGAINFSKRWQQFHIVENMKRFKKCSYSFKRNDRIISYFQNFNDHINEDEMWNLSENIKPRGRKAVQ